MITRSRSLISLILALCLFLSINCSLHATEQVVPDNNYYSGRTVPYQNPDLVWQPSKFSTYTHKDARYIDYDNGNDNNAGMKDSPWKHHPWDNNATGNAAASKGIKTYLFKKGAIYRGTLIARESGTKGKPIRLSIDPGWGTGKAILAGSDPITKNWYLCTESETNLLPENSRGKTWCNKSNIEVPPRLLWKSGNTRASRIPIARLPNWSISNPDDPRSDWFELTDVTLDVRIFVESTDRFSVGDWINQIEPRKREMNHRITEVGADYIQIKAKVWKRGELKNGNRITNGKVTTRITKHWGTHEILRHLKDEKNIPQINIDDYRHSAIWVEGSHMPKPAAGNVINYNRSDKTLEVNFHLAANIGPKKYQRYFLEDMLQFLDIPGEYYFRRISRKSGILYLRLPDDQNPNNVIIETAARNNILIIQDKHHIEISGLTFAYSNQMPVGTYEARTAPLYASAIQIRGSSSNINIHHSHFNHLPAGIIAFPSKNKKGDVLDFIEISDNTFSEIDGPGIALGNGTLHYSVKKSGARLKHVKVLRNKLEHIGYRSLAHWALGSHGHGIEVTGGEVIEVAGNHINNVWGSGIAIYLGSEYERGNISNPFLRGLIHHNKVTNSVLGLQDYGGIASWMGGPVYMYNNISGNPVGYKYADDKRIQRKDWFRRSSFGIGLYLDGVYKSYVFNNILWGLNNNINNSIYNAAAFKEAMGFMNTVFNNTFSHFAVGMHKDMFQHNRSYYLGNLFLDMGHKNIQQEHYWKNTDYKTIGFAQNIFTSSPTMFGQFGGGRDKFKTLESWQSFLKNRDTLSHSTGIIAKAPIVTDSNMFDFRPRPESSAIDYGVKTFVPWSLYRVVGEWNFLKRPGSPDIITGENLNMNEEWLHRSMFQYIPRNDLHCYNVNKNSYREGILEDWIQGALRFNGTNQYCKLNDEDLRKGYSWKKRSGQDGYTNPETRDTVDIGTENFTIESVILTDKNSGNAAIVSKIFNKGYTLELDEQGHIRMTVLFDNQRCSRTSTMPVNDGKWHHIIAEIDRNNPEGINIYVDGKLVNGLWQGTMNSTKSISNNSDFYVGRGRDSFFRGDIDYLRISKGTLADAETNISELYQWQFDGPFLKDFSGEKINGIKRDAGAVEYSPALP